MLVGSEIADKNHKANTIHHGSFPSTPSRTREQQKPHMSLLIKKHRETYHHNSLPFQEICSLGRLSKQSDLRDAQFLNIFPYPVTSTRDTKSQDERRAKIPLNSILSPCFRRLFVL